MITWIHQNYEWLTLVVAVVTTLIALIAWLLPKATKNEGLNIGLKDSALSNSPITAGSHNTQMVGHNVYIGSPAAEPKPEAPKRRPHLTCINAVVGSIHEPSPGEFIERDSNENAIIIRFANDSKQGDVNAGTAVKALVAYLDGEKEISGTNGYWLEDFRDYASFRVDDRRSLLAGILVKGELLALHRNRVTVAINSEAFPVETKRLTNFQKGFLLVKLTDANNGDFLHEAKFTVQMNPLSINRIL
jgi:hypothetical protein